MAAENIKQAYVMFNGQKIVATYDAETDLWTAETNAPAESSWGQPNHVYLAEVHAEDLAGNTASVTSTDSTYGDQLKIRVLEKTKPSVTITSPTQDAVIGANQVKVVASVSDSGGSGLNRDSLVVKVNGSNTTVFATVTENDEDEGRLDITYNATNLSDGINTVEVSVSDNDGNSDSVTVSFVISTQAPLLEVYTPTEGLITNGAIVVVTGKATTSSEYVDISTVTINGDSTPVLEDGFFSYNLPLTNGANVVEVIATDTVGKTTKITRNVTLDTNAPVITDVHAEATTVDAGGLIKITFRVTDS